MSSMRFDQPQRTAVTTFEITYGASGALAEVPIHMAYQPRWWFKVELFLTGV